MKSELGLLSKIGVINHHLRLFGIISEQLRSGSSLIFIDRIVNVVENALSGSSLAIAVNPTVELLNYLKINFRLNIAWYSIIRYVENFGLTHYRLGPIFPELPKEWPVSKVSRFKAKFGGDAYTIIQGSKFLNPTRYQAGFASSEHRM